VGLSNAGRPATARPVNEPPLSSSAADFQRNIPSQGPAQEENQRHLRLIEPPAPPRPRRIDARIAAADGRAPHGRSRALKLTLSDLAWLIEAAERLEARR